MLSDLASELLQAGKRVIAIANSVFDRFPDSRSARYKRLSAKSGSKYVTTTFKRALLAIHEVDPRLAGLMAKSLDYTKFDPLIGLHVRLEPGADLNNLDDLLRDEVSAQDLPVILRAFDIYKNYGNRRQSVWVDLYQQEGGADRRDLFGLLKYETTLKRVGLLAKIAITLQRGRSFYDLDLASSGELSLLASDVYIATQIHQGDFILIDEPENSLHPRWQREYCSRLLDQFYLHDPRIIIATHSPHIVEGAEHANIGVHLENLSPRSEVFQEPDNRLTSSIEGTLLEVFGVLSPASHYLSEKVARILNELAHGRLGLQEATLQLGGLHSLSKDENQKSFLNSTVQLAKEVAMRREAS